MLFVEVYYDRFSVSHPFMQWANILFLIMINIHDLHGLYIRFVLNMLYITQHEERR